MIDDLEKALKQTGSQERRAMSKTIKRIGFVIAGAILLASLLVGFFFLSMHEASIACDRIKVGMPEKEVDAICRLGSKEVVSLEKTAWLKKFAIEDLYEYIVVYKILGFQSIEVAYTKDHKVVQALPAYE